MSTPEVDKDCDNLTANGDSTAPMAKEQCNPCIQGPGSGHK